ncbi:MAG TPA: putative baseplate assembly protein [Pyrinomonadaceae bacterium]|nr:putative baseplate assembly protein [Pyrinomonadaceae bacterium]
MPLPQPKLDDKTFDVLVEESTKLIPRYAPEWTDHNRHDPGITLIELFAWLTEMQQFYLDAIGPESYLKFLKLLGVKPEPAAAARTEINFRVPMSTLAGGITAGASSLKVTVGGGAMFPDVPFDAIIWNQTDFVEPADDPEVEHIRVRAIATDTFQVQRGEEVAHNQTGKVYGIIVDPGGPVFIPRYTKVKNEGVQTDGQLIFETASPLLVLPLKLKRILTSTRRGLKDNTGANDWDGLSYFAFGEEADADSHLYLGFDRSFPAGQQIALTFDLIDDYEVARGRHGSEETLPLPSALVIWEYYNANQKWTPLDIVATIDHIVNKLEQAQNALTAGCFGAFDKLIEEIEKAPTFAGLGNDAGQLIRDAIGGARGLSDVRRFLFNPRFLLAEGDTTLMLSQSGRLFFKAPSDMGRYEGLSLLESGLFWVRATLRQSGYELAPKVDSISINTIDAFQRDTVSEAVSFSSSGEPGQTFSAESYLAAYGTSLVQVREGDGLWKDWQAKLDNSSGPNDLHYASSKDTATGTATFTFGDGQHGRIPGKGDDQIRVISYLADFEEEQKLGSSNGLPGQFFSLERANALANSLKIEVKEQIVVPLTVTETIKVSGLATFSRTTSPGSNNTFEVKLVVKANAEVCNVSVREELHGSLNFAKDDLPAGYAVGEGADEPIPVFETGRMLPGVTREWTYTVISGNQGGSIGGQLAISIGTGCPAMSEASPISIIEIPRSAEDSRWRDWVRVEDLDASGPNDPHFVFDSGSSAISFGDGINGDIPQAALDVDGDVDRNIRIISMQTCGGENGNVVRHTIREFANPTLLPANLLSLRASQVVAADGGTVSETLEDAQARARADLRTQYQAVTSNDFEFLAINTPGLRVARAKAIPGFSAAGKLDQKASVTVVVLPYGISAKPVPSENFLLNVCRHLDRHRLITTQVEVVAPNYVRVSAQATVLLQAGFELEASRQRIIKALNGFLRPIPEPGDTENLGWPFGRTVFKSEIYELIEKVEGVDCIEKVVLTAQGSGAARDANGNITISPTSVVYSGDHQVDVVTPELECRGGK